MQPNKGPRARIERLERHPVRQHERECTAVRFRHAGDADASLQWIQERTQRDPNDEKTSNRQREKKNETPRRVRPSVRADEEGASVQARRYGLGETRGFAMIAARNALTMSSAANGVTPSAMALEALPVRIASCEMPPTKITSIPIIAPTQRHGSVVRRAAMTPAT